MSDRSWYLCKQTALMSGQEILHRIPEPEFNIVYCKSARHCNQNCIKVNTYKLSSHFLSPIACNLLREPTKSFTHSNSLLSFKILAHNKSARTSNVKFKLLTREKAVPISKKQVIKNKMMVRSETRVRVPSLWLTECCSSNRWFLYEYWDCIALVWKPGNRYMRHTNEYRGVTTVKVVNFHWIFNLRLRS